MAEDYSKKEEQLQQRLEKLKALERELKEKEKAVRAKEKSLKEKDKAKKQMVLRLSSTLWNEIAAWAEAVSYTHLDVYKRQGKHLKSSRK